MSKFDADIFYLLDELKRREDLARSEIKELRSPEFAVQNKALDDNARRIALNTTRRGAKTHTFCLKVIETGMKYPRSQMRYFALTRQSAKDIIWDTLQELNDIHNLGIKFNIAELSATFQNKSKLKLGGVDASEKEMKKVLGQKLKLVGIDEAGSMTIDMVKLCYQMIRPALTDLKGTLVLLSTCETIPNTFFQKVTEGQEPGWSVHKWTTYDNPFMAKQWDEEIQEILTTNPLAREASWFKTHYMNEWCTNEDLLIIKYEASKNTFVPPLVSGYNYVLGVDLGYNDASSFVVMAYSQRDPNVYAVCSYKKSGMDITDVALFIKKLQEDYPILKIIVDGANKQGIVEMRRRHQLNLHEAEKIDKVFNLRMLRDDLLTAKFKLNPHLCSDLVIEWASLVWKNLDRDEEDPRCQNHASDAALYAWRECKHYSYNPALYIEKTKEQEMRDLWQQEAQLNNPVNQKKNSAQMPSWTAM